MTTPLPERIAAYTAAGDPDRGFTVVLVDNADGPEGDFVYVESFDTLADLVLARDGLERRLVTAAKAVLRARN